MSTRSRKIYRRRRTMGLLLILVLLAAIVIYTVSCAGHTQNAQGFLISQIAQNIPENQPGDVPVPETQTTLPLAEVVQAPPRTYPVQDANTADFDTTRLNSEYAVLLDVSGNTVLARRNADTRIYPASLTKIMTLLVASEKITDFDATFTMTHEIIAPLIRQDATRAGFTEGEAVNMLDLMYGAALPSGADATMGLAEFLCGSEGSFVELMNQKVQQLGLKDTHFVNTSGLHDPEHYTTATDMAMIVEAAIKNSLCREILSTYQYTTAPTPQHPEGILLESTMFSRMYGNEVENVTILGGKTGYTLESGHCLASFAQKDGKEYIAVTINGTGRYKPIYDAFEIYEGYIK